MIRLPDPLKDPGPTSVARSHPFFNRLQSLLADICVFFSASAFELPLALTSNFWPQSVGILAMVSSFSDLAWRKSSIAMLETRPSREAGDRLPGLLERIGSRAARR